MAPQMLKGKKIVVVMSAYQAEKTLVQTHADIPLGVVAHYDLATVLQRQNRTDEALEQYALALPQTSDPVELAQTRNNLGALYLGRKQYSEAMAQFDAPIQINPHEVNSYLGRGMVAIPTG